MSINPIFLFTTNIIEKRIDRHINVCLNANNDNDDDNINNNNNNKAKCSFGAITIFWVSFWSPN